MYLYNHFWRQRMENTLNGYATRNEIGITNIDRIKTAAEWMRERESERK